jgi:hypothetical protein
LSDFEAAHLRRWAVSFASQRAAKIQALTRGLVVFGCVAMLLLGAALACGAPVADVNNPSSPPALATNVRRTEVADVQRIIANRPTPTLTLAPGAPAPPACPAQGAIWWYEARAHVGEVRTVQGTILATRPTASGLALLEIGQPYPDPTGLAVLIPAAPAASLAGKTVCVAGQITTVEGRPTMQLRDSSSIVVMN